MKKTFILLLFIIICSLSFAQRHTKNLIVITFDGYRWKELFRGADSVKLFGKAFTSQDSLWRVKKYWGKNVEERRVKLMPFFWNTIAKNGQLYGNRDLGNYVDVKNRYWFSFPGYNEIFTGFPDTLINSNDYPDNPHQNVLEYINKQPGYKNKVAVFNSWNAYYRILNEKRSGLHINSGFADLKGTNLTETQKVLNKQQYYLPKIFGITERPDASTYPIAKEYLKQNHPKVLYISFIDTDAFGHQGKYDYYLDAANYNDAMIADLWQYLQSDPFYKDQTTLFVAVDHGRGEDSAWTNHNSNVPLSNEVWFAVMGPDTKSLGEIKRPGQLFQNQYAKTMASFLGFNFPSLNPVGKEIKSVLNHK